MDKPPNVSVVMGAYNAAEHVEESIDSVLRQDWTDFEFIIVNDGSTDTRTAEVLANYARREERIKLIFRPHEGLTKALIAGCGAAQGAYIARIDAGDVMMPSRVRLQKVFLDDHPNVVLVSSWTEFCGPKWEPLAIERSRDTGTGGVSVLPAASSDNLSCGPTHHASVMFRRADYAACGGYRWQFYYGQDWDLWYRLAERGHFHVLPQVLYRARCFPDGISARHRQRQEMIGKCSLEAFHLRRMHQSESPALDRAAFIRPGPEASFRASRRQQASGWYFIGNQLCRHHDRRCRGYLLQCLRRWPLHARAWVCLMLSMLNGRSPTEGPERTRPGC